MYNLARAAEAGWEGTVAEVRDPHSGKQVEVAPATHVGEPTAACVDDHESEGRRRRLRDVTLKVANEHACVCCA